MGDAVFFTPSQLGIAHDRIQHFNGLRRKITQQETRETAKRAEKGILTTFNYDFCVPSTTGRYDFGRGQKEKEQTTIGMICSLLPWKDSNPHRRNQNPECYHYTTRHFGTAKLLLFFDMAIQNHLFFQKKFITDTKFLSK